MTNTGQAYAEYILTNNPALRVNPSGSGPLNLAWTPVADHYLLRSTTNITSADWNSVNIPARGVSADYSAPIEETNAAGFFQLYLP